jgi:hypothetical protein
MQHGHDGRNTVKNHWTRRDYHIGRHSIAVFFVNRTNPNQIEPSSKWLGVTSATTDEMLVMAARKGNDGGQ